MSVNMVIIIIITVLALIIIGFFFMGQTVQQQDRAKMNKIFYETCEAYKAAGCDWSLTKGADFQTYLGACKYLYGTESEALSCLEKHCCGRITIIECEGFCSICQGNKLAGIETASCCQRFNTECTTESCGACP
jgi:hypothetical protein